MFIRTHSWGKANISWSTVQEQLLRAASKLGHETLFVSTNGYEGMEDWTEEKSKSIELAHLDKNVAYDIDVTYTIPVNFSQRFLKSSKVKIGKYDYESSPLPEYLGMYLKTADYVAGSSEYVCDLFRQAGMPDKRVMRIPNGVDLSIFNSSAPKLNLEKLGIKDKFVFLSVAEPHFRKQLDKLCEVYCEVFQGNSDVALIIKTRIADPAVGFEQDIRPILKDLHTKYGDKMPMIKLITSKLKSLAGLYNACDVFVLPTVGEGWGMPFLEALACDKLVIAPKHGGQLDFLTKKNSILCSAKISDAMTREQYATVRIDSLTKQDLINNRAHKGFVGRPDLKEFGELMEFVKNNKDALLQEKFSHMRATAEKFSWEFAVEEMIRRFP